MRGEQGERREQRQQVFLLRRPPPGLQAEVQERGKRRHQQPRLGPAPAQRPQAPQRERPGRPGEPAGGADQPAQVVEELSLRLRGEDPPLAQGFRRARAERAEPRGGDGASDR